MANLPSWLISLCGHSTYCVGITADILSLGFLNTTLVIISVSAYYIARHFNLLSTQVWLLNILKYTSKITLFFIVPIGIGYYLGHIEANELTQPLTWKLGTTWGNDFKILQPKMEEMAKVIDEASNHKLKIEVLSADDLKSNNISIRGTFDAVKDGKIQMMHSAAYYWHEQIPASIFFAAVPFGMDRSEMEAWTNTNAEGYKLWKELYAQFKIIPFPCGHTGPQMGGWFDRLITTKEDFNGITMRIPALGGEVLKKCCGVTQQEIPPQKIASYLQDKRLNAAEWIGPYHDHVLGLDAAGKGWYYYEPGWQEPDTMFELVIREDDFNKLPKHLQTLLTVIIQKYNLEISNEFEVNNREWRTKLLDNHVSFQTFPQPVIEVLRTESKNVLDENVRNMNTELATRIYESYKNANRTKKFSVAEVKNATTVPSHKTR